MHHMHATLIFHQNSYNSDMTKIKHFCTPSPPCDHCDFFLDNRKKYFNPT